MKKTLKYLEKDLEYILIKTNFKNKFQDSVWWKLVSKKTRLWYDWGDEHFVTLLGAYMEG